MVFLDVGLADAVKRVGLGVGRPLLLGNVRSRIKTLLDERRPLYAEVATAAVDTDGRTPEEVADDVARLVEDHEHLDEQAGDPRERTVRHHPDARRRRGAVRRGDRHRAAR